MADTFVRAAVVRDIPALARHRCAMFQEMAVHAGNPHPEALIERIAREYAELLTANLGRSQVGFVIDGDIGERCVASGMIWFAPWLPHPRYPQGAMAYCHSVWTDAACRGRGYARAITQAAIAEARERGHTRLVLHASDAGRPIYDGLGFSATNEMALPLP
jgi:GNAT superfamily N-acetyltransferase